MNQTARKNPPKPSTRFRKIVAGCVVILSTCSLVSAAPGGDRTDPVRLVDPFIGVDKGGNVLPAASLPFSMVRLGPDSLGAPASGYKTGAPVLGFSHNHLSGTGGDGRFCNIRVIPQTGPLVLPPVPSAISDEQAQPAYYSAVLEPSKVRAELTLTERCGVHRYTFPVSENARILIDPTSTWKNPELENPELVAASIPGTGKPLREGSVCTAASAKIVSNRVIEGQGTYKGGWGNNAPHTAFFVAEFDQPFAASGTWLDNVATSGGKETSGTNCGAYAQFKTKAGEQVGLRVGISYLSMENARKNLAQTGGRSFDEVLSAGQKKWRDFLNKIQVEGGTDEQRKLFYTSLYRTVIMPTDVTGETPWKSSEPHYWDFYAFWDTFHCVNSLYLLIIPDRERDIVRCVLDIYSQRGWLPDSWVVGEYADVQGGINSDVVIADAFVKGLDGFDRKLAYEAVKKNATVPSDNYRNFGRAESYFRLGYMPSTSAHCPTSRTLEYAMNDFAAAQIAGLMGEKADAEKFTARSLNSYNLFNPETKFFWTKDAEGKWKEGFDPDFLDRPWWGPYYEGTPWQYALYVPHDVQGLINRHGGDDKFLAFIDQLFDQGKYTQKNEPDTLCPWLYTYISRPDKNVDRVRAILAKDYRTTRDGLPGNDDAGTMSAWYVFGAMGFYPNAGQDVYLMASPIFDKVVMDLGHGKSFTIIAENLSPENKYIQSATLNGKPWNKGWFRHGDIAAGAEMVLKMGPIPSKWGTDGKRPPSVSPPQ